MVGQDTGGAIRGVVRADFYWGSGTEAGNQAGKMRQQGRMWVLLPRGYAGNAVAPSRQRRLRPHPKPPRDASPEAVRKVRESAAQRLPARMDSAHTSPAETPDWPRFRGSGANSSARHADSPAFRRCAAAGKCLHGVHRRSGAPRAIAAA
jgi:hypothetical protein